MKTDYQRAAYLRVLALLDQRRNRSNAETFDQLQTMGYTVMWKRVVWTGGVGSCRLMRSGRLRVQVAATKSGLSRSKNELRVVGRSSLVLSKKSSKRTGYRYGWCIEIPPLL